MISLVIFLGFIVSREWVSIDPEKIRAIQEWPIHTSLFKVQSFHGLATFYHCFIRGFSTITALITNYLKMREFKWTIASIKTFEDLKARLTEAPMLRLSEFEKVFEVACDASGVGVGGVINQEGHPITYFSEKLNNAKK